MSRNKKIQDIEQMKSGTPADASGTIIIMEGASQEEIEQQRKLFPGILVINEIRNESD
jgi:hypothetical protein